MSKYPLVLVILLTISGCRTSTEHGECVGINDKKKDNLMYEISVRNVVLGIVFSESIFVPVNVIFYNFECPVGVK